MTEPQSGDRVPDQARWVSLALFSLGALAFFAFRFYVARPPLTSDDLVHLEYGMKLLAGEHPAFSAEPLDLDLDHWGFRLGIVIPAAIAISAFGYGIEAYYAVPLLFSTLGFITVFWINRRHCGIAIAIAVAAIHVVYPFEVWHGSRLLADLPAAVMLLLYFALVDRAADRSDQPDEWGFILAAGLALFWGYELRTNHPVVLAPGMAVLLLSPRHRRAVVASTAILLAGVLSESLYYQLRGGGWTYRWESVQVEQYMPFYARATWEQYFTRHFRYVERTMGSWAAVYYVLALLGHVWILLTTRTVVIRALVASGLCAWLVFGFYVHGQDPDGRLVVMGLKHRFMQPFYFTALVVLAAALARARDSMNHGALARSARRRHVAGLALIASLGLLFAFFTVRSLRSEDRLNGHDNSFHRAFTALDKALDTRGVTSARVSTLPKSARTLVLFSETPAGRSIRWEIIEPSELARSVGAADHLMINSWRETARTGFQNADERQAHLQALGSGFEIVERQFVKLADSTDLVFHTRWGRASTVTSFPALAWSDLRSSDRQPTGWRALRRRGEAEFQRMNGGVEVATNGYLQMTSGNADPPGAEFGLPANERHELVLRADFAARHLSVTLVHRSFAGDDRGRARRATILPGVNIVGIAPATEPRALQIELHIKGTGRFTLSDAQLRRVDLGSDATAR